MKQKLLTFFLAMSALALNAQVFVEKTPAFPGAEGFGRYTTGGRGGDVYHVTSLADDGSEGTFRWACNKSGKRTIVFDVAGTIYLTSALKLKNGNVTIAGQTSPGSVCIADYPFTINADNVIIRYMSFRPGSNKVADHEGDGLGGMDRTDVIVDHCSVSWSVDECLSVYGSRNLSVQWCLVAQSMVDCGHSKGSHGYGGNWGGAGASYHHNLIAHHTSRTPRLGPRPGTQTDERMDMRNNVIYNWGGNGCYGGEGMKVNIVNNYYKPGPATGSGVSKRIAKVNIRTSEYTNHNGTPNQWDVMWHVWGKYYVAGNVNTKHSDVTEDNWTNGFINQIDASANDGTFTAETKDTIKLIEPIVFTHVTNHTAEVAYAKVCDYVGNSLHRDKYDELILDDVKNGTAKAGTGSGNSSGFINTQYDVKYMNDSDHDDSFYPVIAAANAPADSDGDGMPDEWEAAKGLNPNDKSDGKIVGDDGYTNLERYLNSLVESITAGQLEGGEVLGNEVVVEKPVEGKVAYLYFEGTQDNKITLSNGFTVQITGNTSKTIMGGNSITVDNDDAYQGMKVSNGAQNTVTLPKGMLATKVTFFSYVNKGSGDISSARPTYWKEVNGETFDETSAEIMACSSDKPVDNPDVNAYTLPSVNAFTYTNAGEQVVYVLKVEYYDSSSAVKSVSKEAAKTGNAAYNLSGQRVGSGYKGIVIKNGKKTIF